MGNIEHPLVPLTKYYNYYNFFFFFLLLNVIIMLIVIIRIIIVNKPDLCFNLLSHHSLLSVVSILINSGPFFNVMGYS